MRENFKTLLFIILIITFYRYFALLHAHIDLYVDEAYYWGWSKDLSFGYYSKPPMIAWVIWVFTHLCGDGEICLKFPALFFYPLTTLLIYAIAKELFNQKVAFWSGVAFITLPAVSVSSLIISTDVLLLFFWALTLWAFIKALRIDAWRYWLLAAVAAGAGLLTKYTMIIFILSVFIYLILDDRFRHHLKNPKLYVTMVLAALIYMPNLIWNAQHDFITFVHTKNLSGIEKASHFHFGKLLEFLAAQFLVFGPIFFGAFLLLLIKPRREYRLLYAFSVPFLAIISLQAFISKALANWAAPTYVAATIMVVAYLVYKKRLLVAAILLNIFLALLLYHYHDITRMIGIELTSHTDPYKRVLGYKELAAKFSKIVSRYPHHKLLFDDRTTMAEMIYYLRPHPFDAAMYNPAHRKSSQYHLFNPAQKGASYIFISRHPHKELGRYFHTVTPLGTIEIPLYKDYTRRYYIYKLERFKGYK